MAKPPTKAKSIKLSGRRMPLTHDESALHRPGAGEYIASLILGANDGIITTFVVVAGATGASLAPLVIIVLGFANVIGDAVSMGLGNYLGEKSEDDYNKGQREIEEWEVENFPVKEKEEVREIFSKWNFAGKDLDRAVDIVTSDKKVWVDVMMKEELGIVERGSKEPIREGLATFVAFVVAGIIPLTPFIIPGLNEYAGLLATIFAGTELFIIGAMRSFVSPQKWFKGGMEMLLVGALAGGLAYGVGYLIDRLINNI